MLDGVLAGSWGVLELDPEGGGVIPVNQSRTIKISLKYFLNTSVFFKQ